MVKSYLNSDYKVDGSIPCQPEGTLLIGSNKSETELPYNLRGLFGLGHQIIDHNSKTATFSTFKLGDF